jgi:hypothetical protein
MGRVRRPDRRSPGPRARRSAVAAVAGALCAGPLLGCASAPPELARLRVENELLREELRIVRQNCSFYRDLELKLDEESPPKSP